MARGRASIGGVDDLTEASTGGGGIRRAICDQILLHWERHGEGPTIAAVSRAMGRPPSSVQYHVARLRERGEVVARGRELVLIGGRVYREHAIVVVRGVVRRHGERHGLEVGMLERALERRLRRMPASG